MSTPRSTPAAASRCWPCRRARSWTPAAARPSSSTRARAASSRARSSSAIAATAMSRCGEGVAEGEPVVVSANFLIDAESNLKAALKGFAEAGGAAMIARLIAWSARNLLLVLFGTGFAAAAGIYALRPSAARCHPRPLRHPGHRLHRISRPGAAGDRGPGHLSADDGDADGAEIEGGARLLVLRRLVRLRHLRGRHRHLLGALARAGISQRRGLAAAGRRDADHRPRRDRRRLGLPVCGDVEGAEPRRHAHDPGLESEIRAGQGGRRRRGRQRRRLRQAVQRDPRSAADARSRHHHAEDARRDPRQQRRCRRPHRRTVGVRIRHPRQGLHQDASTTSATSC